MKTFKINFSLARLLFSVLILSGLSACATSGSSNSVAQKQASVIEMRQDVLSEIYEKKPDVKAQIANSSGYGVFSNVNVNFLIASVGGGHGIVRNNRTGEETYMNMGEVGLGLGAGLKDFRALFVFHTPEALDYFVNKGWSFGAQADAAAKASDKGGAVGGEVVTNNVTIYQLTKSGLALQATLKGAKFWKNRSLNKEYSQNTQYQQSEQIAPTTTTYPQTTTTYPQTTTTYPSATTVPQTTTTTRYPQATTVPQTTTTTRYPQATTYPQTSTTYPQATTVPQTTTTTRYPQATTYPQTSTTTSPQAPSTTTSYPQVERSIVVVPDVDSTTPNYQQQGNEYIRQGNEYIQQGSEYIQQGTQQIPGSQYIQE